VRHRSFVIGAKVGLQRTGKGIEKRGKVYLFLSFLGGGWASGGGRSLCCLLLFQDLMREREGERERDREKASTIERAGEKVRRTSYECPLSQ
jgi:hypothetical protein